jgi:hypothetical protein
MIQPRYSRLSRRSTKTQTRQELPTGSSFGGSSLKATSAAELTFLIEHDSAPVADYQIPVWIEQPSPLVIEAGKIAVIAVWFWCLIGADFCFDLIGTIVSYCSQEV